MAVRQRILAVDDNPTNLAILEEMLEAEFHLVTASSGEQALEVLHDFEQDLILLDIMMPGIDGYEVCRQIRQSSSAHAKIIMVSARTQTPDRLAGYEAGADDYMTKPFDEMELRSKIDVYLKLKSVQEVDAIKCRMLEVLQHGSRTPLAGMLSACDLLAGDYITDPEQQKEVLQSIQRCGQRLLKWLNKGEQLLQLSNDPTCMEPREVDAARLLDQVLESHRTAIEEKRVFVEADMPESLILLADADHLEQVFGAIVSNALHVTPSGKHVSIELSEEAGRVRFSVQDQGPGIDAAILPSIFEPFSDCESVLHNQGDGMSLAIAKEIVLAHSGLIRARNIPKGGARFDVDLPVEGPDQSFLCDAVAIPAG